MSGSRRTIAAWANANVVLIAFGACALVQLLRLGGLAAQGGFGEGADTVDFLCFWTVGRGVRLVGAAALYDWQTLLGLYQQLAGHNAMPYLPWLYPPSLLLVLEPLSVLGLDAAHLLWSFGTLALFLAVVGAIAGRLAVVAALACPLVRAECLMGQTGFLTASLLGGALLAGERRPVLAGVLTGLLACKPQLDLMLPLMLVATAQWRAIAAAAATFAVVTWLSALLYGAGAWTAFAAALQHNGDLLAQGRMVPFVDLQSVYGLLRQVGVDHVPAIACHALLVLAAAGLVVAAGRRMRSPDLRAACTAFATVLASPYLLVWDLTLLGIAVAFLARASPFGVRAGLPAFVAMFILPTVTVAAGTPTGPLCFLLVAAAILLCRSSPHAA